MNLPNAALTNVFSKALIVNANAPRYARSTFAELVSATMLTKSFQRAIKSADALFGIAEDKVITRKLKHAKRTKHAKVAKVRKAKASKLNADGSPRKPRGRPKGSKNKPKLLIEPSVAESRPLVDPADEAPAVTLES